MSKFKKTAMIVIVCVIAAVVALNMIARTGNNIFANAANTVLTPFQTAAATVTNPIKNFISYLTDMKDYKSENERLKSELETLKKESRNQEELKKENTRLKKLLQLTDEMTNSKTVPAKVISYEPGNWFHTLVINKGSMQGIKVSDVVITESGLIGKVTEVGVNWARVSTILDAGNAVGVKLTRTGDVGVAEGDTELLKTQRFKLDYISKETSLISGDLLETSGLGGIYPPGLSVGSVEEVQLNNTGELVKATIKPAVDFDELYEVIVVTYWEPAVYDREQVEIEYSEETYTDDGDYYADSDEDEQEESAETPKPKKTEKPEETKEPEETQKPEATGSPDVDSENSDPDEAAVSDAQDGTDGYAAHDADTDGELYFDEQGEDLE